MLIQFISSGGFAYFPGLNKPVTIETAQLPAAESIELEQLIKEAHFFELPSSIPPSPGAADYQQYEITVSDGDQHHTVLLTNLVNDPNLLALLSRLIIKSKELRSSLSRGKSK